MDNSQLISVEMIKHQSWKYYFITAAWPLYLLVLPLVFSNLGFASVLFMIFPGVFLFTWVGYLMHESWHKYVPNVLNVFFFNVLSWMLLTEPRMVEGRTFSMSFMLAF